MGSSDLAGLSAFDEVLAMGSTWPFLGDPTVASGGRQRTAPGGFDHQGSDAPSAWLSLVGLRPRRARLRFTRQHQSNRSNPARQAAVGHRSHASENPPY